MENLPSYVSIIFGLTTALTVFLFYKAANYSKPVIIILLAWLALQTTIALTGFYTITDTMPPRFALLVLPPLIFTGVLFFTTWGNHFINTLNIKTLTLLHIIRIPVEIVLLWLFLAKAIPKIMTFEGRNFDILSGVSAPLIYYFCFVKKRLSQNIVLIWNVICLLLLINIVTIAVLSAPFVFQKFAFDQPNTAVFHFPFIWLPGCIVPIVLISQLAAIKQLIAARKNNNL